MLAIDAIRDMTIKAKFAELAPNAQAGSLEAQTAWDQAVDGLDFDSSDGTPADSYGDKGLDAGQGGRTILLQDKIMVNDGATLEEAKVISNANFIHIANQSSNADTLGGRIADWKAAQGVV